MPSNTTCLSECLLHIAQREARRVCRIARLPAHAADDIRQDMLLDLLGRIGAFDPQRGSLEAFATVCFRHRGSRVPRRQVFGGIGEQTVSPDLIAQLERRLDLMRACANLDRADAALCAALSNATAHALARRTGASRAGLYRRRHEIQMRLRAAGIAPA